MKSKFYSIPILVFYLSVFHFSEVNGQCGCSDGEVPTEITYNVSMPATASSNIISFPKFDPAIGILSCVIFKDTTTMESRLGIRNLDPATLDYSFLLIIGNTITGPGISVSNSSNKPYGPVTLGGNGSGTDSVSFGPDTLINGISHSSTNNSDVTAYYGATGTVDFTYSTNGGAVSTGGGTNFSQVVRTQSTGQFSLTYFWCPSTVLSSRFDNFRISTNNQFAHLTWGIKNDDPENRYEIQVSSDGVNFTTIRNVSASNTGNYSFDLASNEQYRYFRIKQVDASGGIFYSAVRKTATSEPLRSYTSFPNPATDQINIQSAKLLSGNYHIQLFNSTGQVVMQQQQTLSGTHAMVIKLASRPSPGIYYLKTRNRDNPAEAETIKIYFK